MYTLLRTGLYITSLALTFNRSIMNAALLYLVPTTLVSAMTVSITITIDGSSFCSSHGNKECMHELLHVVNYLYSLPDTK